MATLNPLSPFFFVLRLVSPDKESPLRFIFHPALLTAAGGGDWGVPAPSEDLSADAIGRPSPLGYRPRKGTDLFLDDPSTPRLSDFFSPALGGVKSLQLQLGRYEKYAIGSVKAVLPWLGYTARGRHWLFLDDPSHASRISPRVGVSKACSWDAGHSNTPIDQSRGVLPWFSPSGIPRSAGTAKRPRDCANCPLR